MNMVYNEIKYDCIYFKGDMPCLPNKLRGKECLTCDEYSQVSKKILIIKLGALGDVIRTTPLVKKYKSLYPESHISWVTLSPEVLTTPLIDSVFSFDFRSLYILKNSKFDIAVNLDKDKEACILLNELDAKEKYGFTWLNNHISAANKSAEHKMLTGMFDSFSKENRKSYLEEIFEICQLEFNHEPYLLDVDNDFFLKWKKLHQVAQGRKIVGLNTGCGKRWLTRLWPYEYWIILINMLKKGNYFPVLLGGPDEENNNSRFSNETGAYYPGTFSLREYIAIISNCDLIVSAVTFTMHIAVALSKPLVLFNNIFNKNEFDLYGNGEILEPSSGCDCFYGNTCSRNRHCMYDLLPERVFESIVSNLK